MKPLIPLRLRLSLLAVLCCGSFPVADALAPLGARVASAAEAADELHGEGAHGGGATLLSLDPGAAIWNLLIFILVLLFLMKFVWPHILGGLKAREQKIHDDLEGAEQANAAAKGLLADYEQRLAAAHAETQAMLAQARKDAEAAGQRIVAEAKEEAGRQRQRTLSEIENAKKVALAELADQTTAVAMKIAQQVVGRELRPEDHEAIIRSSLDQLPSQN